MRHLRHHVVNQYIDAMKLKVIKSLALAKRLCLALIGVSLLFTASLLYYAGDLKQTDIVFRRMWNSVVYLTGLSQLRQNDFGNLVVHGLVSVYDGDTFTCDIDGLHPLIGESISIRIRGIDAPEMKDERSDIREKSIQARDYLRRRLVTAEKIELRHLERDKYFRILADVYVNEILISRELVAKKLAKPYDGGTKSLW